MGQLPVIVIGAGISGLSLAYELARRGQKVIVLEQSLIASGASGAAGAYLEPRTGTGGLRAIEWASLAQWPAFAHAVAEASGIDLDYRKDGLLHVALEDGLPRLRRDFEARRSAATPATWLTGEELRALEPQLAPAIVAGYRLNQVHTLDARKFCTALAATLQQAGTAVQENTQALEVSVEDDVLQVNTNQGALAGAKVAVCCAMGRNDVAGLPADVPLSRPIRGVMLALATQRPLVRRVIKHAKGVICPRSDGRLLVGPTSEKGETSPVVADQVKQDLLAAARRFVPAVAELEISDACSGIRALVGDGALKLGQSRILPGVYFSLSHGGSGYLRAPVVARELAAYMLDEAAPCPLTSPYLARL